MATLKEILHSIVANLGNTVAADAPQIHEQIDELFEEVVEDVVKDLEK